MPEAEVGLRLADYLLDRLGSVRDASLSIDGAAAKRFEIERYLQEHGWNQLGQTGKNRWTGQYERNGKQLEIHCRPGEGDLVIRIGRGRLIAECKKGPRTKSSNGQERRLLAEAIGQATKWPAEQSDLIIVAVPYTQEFHRVAGDWIRSPLFQRTGIQITLVGEDDAVVLVQTETAMELDTLLPSLLDKAFKGEL
jgi:hypothetical protein